MEGVDEWLKTLRESLNTRLSPEFGQEEDWRQKLKEATDTINKWGEE